MTAPPDPFSAIRARLLPVALKNAAFDGFTGLMLKKSAAEAGLSEADLAAALPGGAVELLEYWSDEADRAAGEGVAAAVERKVREKIAAGVEARIAYLRPHKEACRRAAANLAFPHNAPLGARLVWNTADALWRALGDASTDFNFYTKRAILSGVWIATFARWLADNSLDDGPTKAFLKARIDNVMQFEKLKARRRGSGFDIEGAVGGLAKLRYAEHGRSVRAKQEAKIDEALKESFPASDPPFWTGGVSPGRRHRSP